MKRKTVVLLAALTIAIFAAARYAVLVNEASSSLSRFFFNGYCSGGLTSCTFYLQAPADTLSAVAIVFNGTRYVYIIPYGGLVFESVVTGGASVNDGRVILTLISDGRSLATLAPSTLKPSPIERVRTRVVYHAKVGVEPGTGRAFELKLQPSIDTAYVALVRMEAGCKLDVKLYAFQDRLAWEELVSTPTAERIVVPMGGALDDRGLGPVYTKMVVNNVGSEKCIVEVEVYKTPTVKFTFILTGQGDIDAVAPVKPPASQA